MLPKKILTTVSLMGLLFALGVGIAWITADQALAAEGAAQSAPVQPAVSSASDADSTDVCREVRVLLEQQKTQMGREFGQIKREMAVLREDLGKPGAKEIFAGIGYILGLAGIALYMHCRRTSSGSPRS